MKIRVTMKDVVRQLSSVNKLLNEGKFGYTLSISTSNGLYSLDRETANGKYNCITSLHTKRELYYMLALISEILRLNRL